MTTVLITNGVDPDALCLSRCQLRLRLLAWLRSSELDELLASGVSADSSVLLSLAAHSLHSAVTRRRLARELRRVVAESARTHHPFDSPLPLARAEIQRSQDLIRNSLTRWSARNRSTSVALPRRNCCSDTGMVPLYNPQSEGSLRECLQEAIDSLSVPPTHPCDDLVGVS